MFGPACNRPIGVPWIWESLSGGAQGAPMKIPQRIRSLKPLSPDSVGQLIPAHHVPSWLGTFSDRCKRIKKRLFLFFLKPACLRPRLCLSVWVAYEYE